jgi:hypothetical protein
MIGGTVVGVEVFGIGPIGELGNHAVSVGLIYHLRPWPCAVRGSAFSNWQYTTLLGIGGASAGLIVTVTGYAVDTQPDTVTVTL